MFGKKVDSMVFSYETTAKTDYQDTKIQRPIRTLYEDKGPRIKHPPAPLKAWETMNDWKVPFVPFNLLWKKRDIIETHPEDLQKPYQLPIDHEREHVQKTRPRVILTPGSVLDDLEEPARQLLLNGMYLTNEKYMMREAVRLAAKNLNIRAPLPKTYAPTKPIYLPRFRPPFVSPEWRMDSMVTVNYSMRGYVEPDKEFWTSQTPHDASDETAQLQNSPVTETKALKLK